METFRCLLAVAVLLAGCAHAPASSSSPPLSETERTLALELIKAAEVDARQIDQEFQRRLVKLAQQTRCPCSEQRVPLSECIEVKGCIRAPFAVRSILRGILSGDKDEKIESGLLERFGPRDPEQIDLAHAPCRGKADAPVVMVILSDFQCPFCGLATELVETVEKAAGDRLRVCFKHFPLTTIHPQALLAARAAVAAQLQEKFWTMHDRLFANQQDLERDDLLEHAKAVGLDPERFEQDLDSDAVKNHVERDIQEAVRLRLRGTPTFFINGRQMTDPKTVPDFLDWIAEAIALKKR